MHRAHTLLAACAIPSIYASTLQVLCTSSFIFTRRITLCINKKKTASLDFLHSHLMVGLLCFNSLIQYMSLVTVTCIVLVNTLQDTKLRNYIIMM